MAPDHSFAGVNRDARPRAQGDIPTGNRRDPAFRFDRGYTVMLEGASASSAQTSLALACGSLALIPGETAIPVPFPVRTDAVGVAWLSDSDPGAPWTLTLQVRYPGSDNFVDAAELEVTTSE